MHHHVEPAAPLDRRPHQAIDVVPAGRVGLDEDAAPALLLDQLDGRPPTLARILADVADHHVGPLGRERQRHRPPEARRSAGDDDRLAGEAAAQLRSPFASPPSTRIVMPFR